MEKERNIATLYSAPGYTNFHALWTEADVSIEDYAPIVALQAKTNGDKEQKEIKGSGLVDPGGVLHKFQLLTTYAETPSTHYPDIAPYEEDKQSNTYTAELLRLHHKFGQCSFWEII